MVQSDPLKQDEAETGRFVSIDLENAMRLHKRGDLAAAEPLYRAVLQVDSNHVEANYLLGALFIQSQRVDEALRLLRKVVSLQPNHFMAHHQVGDALRALGDIQGAIEQYRKAVRINPNFIDGLNSLGCALRDTRQYDEAEAAFARLIDADPTFAPGYYNLGLVHLERQEVDLAVRRFHDAIDWDTDSFDAYRHLGHAYRKKKDYDQAIAYYNKALQMRPADARVVTDIGVIFQLKQDFPEAKRWYERALAFNSELPEALCNMGTLCQARGSYDEAMKYYEHALGIHPDYVECLIAISDTYQKLAREKEALASAEYAMYLAPDRFRVRLCFAKALLWNNRFDEAEHQLEWCLSKHAHHVDALIHMGLLNVERGRPELALQWFNRVIDGNPRDAAAHRLRGEVLLALGRLEQGWQEWDWEGLNVERSLPFNGPCAIWKGEDLDDTALLIYFDGDVSHSLLLASCLPDLLGKSQQCEIRCEASLVSLFQRSFPHVPVKSMDDPIGATDQEMSVGGYYCAASSMPRYLRKQLEAFAAPNAYLAADAERVQQWRQKLRELGPGLKIGLAWQGGRMNRSRGLHEVCLDDFGEILARPSAAFIALVEGEGDADVAELEKRFGVDIHRFDGVMKNEHIDDLFALIAALDRVVTTNVLPLHVAGSLGKSAWMLSRPHRDWLNLGTDDIPWYPSVRRVIKIGRDEWTIPMEKLVDEVCSDETALPANNEVRDVKGNPSFAEANGQSDNQVAAESSPLRENPVAVESSNAIPSDAKTTSKTLFMLALEHYQQDDLSGAEEYCHLGLEDQPNDVNLLSLLATIFAETERGAVALALLEKARTITPSDSALCIQLSRVYALLGLDAQRIEMLVNLCRCEVESGEAHLELAHALEQAGNLDAAAVAAQLASLLLLKKSEAQAMLVDMGKREAAGTDPNNDTMNMDASMNGFRNIACANVDSAHLLTWQGALTAALTQVRAKPEHADGVIDQRG